MTISTITRSFQYLFVAILPFLVFYWMAPFFGDLSIGNDYVMFSIDHQLALQYSLKKGSFPLFAPGFAGGQSAAALTLGQIYHPLSHLAALTPSYWTGTPLEGNTLFKLLGIGLTHLALFSLLIRLKLRDAVAFILSFIAVYNLRMLDMFRYGAALENYLGFILLSAVMAHYYLKPTRVAGPAAVICATYLLVTGGHPQIMYFGLLGAGLSAVLIPFVIPALNKECATGRREVVRFYVAMSTCLVLGILLATAYILPFYLEFIRENSARVARNYRWSLGYSDSWSGVLNSFFRPLHSNVHGAFGSSSIILFAALSPLLLIFQKRIPKIVLVLFGLTLLVFLISLGGATPIHRVFWTVFPLADTFRTPGRINMLLPMLFLFTLAWQLRNTADERRRFSLPSTINPRFLLALAAILVYVVYNVFLIHIVPQPTHYHPYKINDHSHQITLIAYWTGLATLILLALYLLLSTASRKLATRFRAILGVLLCAAVLLQTGVELRWGTWVVNKRTKPTLKAFDNKMGRQLKVIGLAGFGMEPVTVSEQMKHSILDPNLATFYRTYHTVPDNAAAYDYIAKHRKSTEATVVSSQAPKKQAVCPNSNSRCKEDKIELTSSSYNQVTFKLEATEAGLFTVSYPFMSRFEGTVDGAPVPILETNGYQLGLFVPKGEHQITVRYNSTATRVGIAISLMTLFALTLLWGFRQRRRYLRFVPPVLGLLIAAAVFYLFNKSLYSGDNLNTKYHWTSKSISPEDNLAYGKVTEMTGIKSHERPYECYAGKGVDGKRTGAGFTSDKNKSKQWWQVDLGKKRPVNRIVLYDRYSLSKHTPLLIQISDNGKTFETASTIDTFSGPRNTEVALNDVHTRYIRLKSSGKGALSLKEVEVYGPSKP